MFTRFGVLLELHIDQGRTFESAVFSKICELLFPQYDGMIERFNRTFDEHLCKVIDKGQRGCDNDLPLFLMEYRAAVHETISLTPTRLIFARAIRLPCDLMFGSPSDEETDYLITLKNFEN